MAKNNDQIIFLQEWFNELANDEFTPASPEELAYILYAATRYSWFREKTNFEEVFDRADLNKIMTTYYAQIDRITGYRENSGKNNQKYDNEAVKALAAKGLSQKAICMELGYDVSKARSLSSNSGYREGRALYKNGQNLSENNKTESELTKNDKTDVPDKNQKLSVLNKTDKTDENQKLSETDKNQSEKSEVVSFKETDDLSEVNKLAFNF